VYQTKGGRFARVLGRLLDIEDNARCRRLKSLRPSAGNLVDVGCGKGRFLRVSSTFGWSPFGIDLALSQASAAAQATAQPTVVASHELIPLASGTQGAVTAWHALEHMIEPRRFLQEVKRLLDSTGVLALEVPNFGSWQSKIAGARWFQLDPPRHLWHFTPSSIRVLLEAEGYEVLRLTTWSLQLGPLSALVSAQNRLGMEPSALFKTLKRTGDTSLGGQAFVLLTSALLVPFTTAAEAAAAVFRRGGVLRVYARPIGHPAAQADNGG
jgi:SAM-dependent methyltransferase